MMANDGGVWTKIYPDVASLGGGKVLQVVRETKDDENVETNNTDFEFAGLDVSITPKQNDSMIIVLAQLGLESRGGQTRDDARLEIQDHNGNKLMGAENVKFGGVNKPASNYYTDFAATVIGSEYPATTTEVTYRLMFKSLVNTMTVHCRYLNTAGQLFAIEVAQ